MTDILEVVNSWPPIMGVTVAGCIRENMAEDQYGLFLALKEMATQEYTMAWELVSAYPITHPDEATRFVTEFLVQPIHIATPYQSSLAPDGAIGEPIMNNPNIDPDSDLIYPPGDARATEAEDDFEFWYGDPGIWDEDDDDDAWWLDDDDDDWWGDEFEEDDL